LWLCLLDVAVLLAYKVINYSDSKNQFLFNLQVTKVTLYM
jgi:hypothetical protein